MQFLWWCHAQVSKVKIVPFADQCITSKLWCNSKLWPTRFWWMCEPMFIWDYQWHKWFALSTRWTFLSCFGELNTCFDLVIIFISTFGFNADMQLLCYSFTFRYLNKFQALFWWEDHYLTDKVNFQVPKYPFFSQN